MSTPTVSEALMDPFVADLDQRSPKAEVRLAAFVQRAVAEPQQRIDD